MLPNNRPHLFENQIVLASIPTGIAGPTRELSEAERKRGASIVALGCDRSTAGKELGFSLAEWERMVGEDAVLAAALARAEAEAEIHHMKCIQQAAKEPKNFRGSIWWLERMRPDVYHRRDADVFAREEVEQFVEVVLDEVADEGARQRIMNRFTSFTHIS
jgi:hypothetical protein